MPQYRYQARNFRGERVEGLLESSSSDAVANQLLNSDLTPIDITLDETRPPLLESLSLRVGLGGVELMDLIMFSRQMHTLMRAGVPIIRTIKGLAETTRNLLLRRTLEDVADKLESGRPLGDCLGEHPRVFSNLYVSIIQVGENTGRLDETFLQMAGYLDLEKEMRDRVKSALRYPTFVIIAIAVAMAVINLMVIPAFAKAFGQWNAELPWPTLVLISVSEFWVAYWPYMLVGLVLLIVAVRAYIATGPGRYQWDRYKLRLPLAGKIIRQATLGRFARAFSMSLTAGVPLIQGLTVVARAVDNEFVAGRILDMRNGIERGETVTRAAQSSGLFTPLVQQMLAVGEETGAIGELMEQVADYYEREVDYDLKRLSAAIEPILIVVIGGMVLLLALGVFLPMWDLPKVALGR